MVPDRSDSNDPYAPIPHLLSPEYGGSKATASVDLVSDRTDSDLLRVLRVLRFAEAWHTRLTTGEVGQHLLRPIFPPKETAP